MKKHVQTLLVISVSLCIFSCSKKVTTFNFGKPYHEGQSKIAMDEKEIICEDIVVTASSEPNIVVNSPNQKTELASSKPLNKAPEKTFSSEKPGFKNRVLNKIVKKKIEKLEKSQAVDSKMKIGIVIAAISLVVLIVAVSGLLGGLGGLFTILGALGLITGLIIILLVALDVI